MTRYKLVKNSQPGGKLGGMSAVWVSSDTCPKTCKLREEESCYAFFWNTKKAWENAERSGVGFAKLLELMRDAGLSRFIRWAPAGDLPGDADRINHGRLFKLVTVLSRLFAGFIMYTHKPIEGVHRRGHHMQRKANRRALDDALRVSSSAINISCDSADEAERALELGYDATMILPSSYTGSGVVVGRFKGRVCWAQSSAAHPERKSCSNCGRGVPWCSRKGRGWVVQFIAHGARKTTINRRLPILD